MAGHNSKLQSLSLDLTLSSIFFFILSLLIIQQPSSVTSTLQLSASNHTSLTTLPSHSTELLLEAVTLFTAIPATPTATTGDFLSKTSNVTTGSKNESASSIWIPGPDSPYGTVATVIISLVLFCVIVGTIIGNILVCIAVCLVRKLRRPCNYLLVSLAVSDLCVATLVMPLAMVYDILGHWPFGPVVCDFWVSIDVLSCAASILNLCMISVDRYYAITKPLEYGVKRTPKRMVLCVLLVWFGAACISLPPLLILGNEREESHCIVCQNFGYQIYATLGSFYIPLIVMMVVYYKIFRAARKIVMEEKRAQSHLESHCYLEINVKNGGAAESRLLQNQGGRQSTSGVSTAPSGGNSSSGVEKSLSTIGRCFSGEQRKSNESQCPMLQTPTNRASAGASQDEVQQPLSETSTKQSTGKKKRCIFKKRDSLNVFKGQKVSKDFQGNVTNSPHQKKLRFQLAKERKASTTLGIIMSAFIFCWLPFFVLALVRPFLDDPDTIPRSLSSTFLWLGYANSLLNPIIYATLNKDFRKPFQEILFFRCSNLNHMMREEFYHSQYGDPEQHYCVVSSSKAQVYEESVEIVTAEDRELKERTSESFL